MSDSIRPAGVDSTLRDVAGGAGQELVFDTRSGLLVVTGEPQPDDTIATDAAVSGYFR
ncbi:hypothetical protein F4553_002081 [Allocatelliglobosispora scoriae]|uniref:Uncharacterized protein n=1 Tax=Allocatelliglobosispora scoriae TaxID=643052 RepID=A0A841BPM7_9ACTN|nr:hypothetical protein [Allocatelliglobosispora scoriae]MBB5868702.1 hypothetical protein [Allocatelliglobosispora scoriae]